MPHAPAAAHLRAVLDTNIYVAALVYPAGRTAALWIAAMDRRYRVLVSPDIIRELARLRSDFGWEEPRIQKAIRFIAQIAEVVTPRMKSGFEGVLPGLMSASALLCRIMFMRARRAVVASFSCP